jgi:hypothetical protein
MNIKNTLKARQQRAFYSIGLSCIIFILIYSCQLFMFALMATSCQQRISFTFVYNKI